MVKVLSPIHHGLRLPALDVKFVDGVAEVDETLLPKVLAFAHLGVTLANESTDDTVPEEGEDSDESAIDPDADADDLGGDAPGGESDEADESEEVGDDESDEAEEDAATTERPRRNASLEAWVAYASTLGVPVADDATRDEVRALFD